MSALEKAIKPERILLDVDADTWKIALNQGIALLKGAPSIINYEALREEILSQQLETPTSLGNGLTVPHVRTTHVQQITLSLLRLREPLPLGIAGPAIYVIVAAIPKTMAAEYLQVIGCVARLFGKENSRHALDDCNDTDAFFQTLKHLSHAL